MSLLRYWLLTFLKIKELDNESVVSTVMSNYGFKIAMKNNQFNLIETPRRR